MPYVHMRLPYSKLDDCGLLRTTCCPSLRKQLSFVVECGIHALPLNSGDPAPSAETVDVASLSLITRKAFVQQLLHHLISSRLYKSTLFAFNYSIRCHAIHRARGQLYFRFLTLMFRHLNQITLSYYSIAFMNNRSSHQMLKTNNKNELDRRNQDSKRFGFAIPCATVVADVAIIVFIKGRAKISLSQPNFFHVLFALETVIRELPFSRRREGLSYRFQCIVRYYMGKEVFFIVADYNQRVPTDAVAY
ncbi:hypothetical protein Tsp_05849 [Trichinella spiralis]|uniref:hypothetical protein n=1 Tax=Trichinella spiralis TaxID=6334 RepID=UPI0001EFC3CB|nr:hypothetical protein Tsp_05849 [Trichinella spiralis]